MKKIRNSKQRNRILELLKGTTSHPTANWIYNELKDEFPHLSMGTVYRNLNILDDLGLVKRLNFGSTFDRFDAQLDKHCHFICEKCNAVIDLDFCVQNELTEKVAAQTGLIPTSCRVEFFGICDKCKRK